MNATLCDRLILVEQLFLIAVVSQDETALRGISLELSWLIPHLKAVEASGDLDDRTTLLLSRVSRVIRATTQCMLGCEDILKEAQTYLQSYSGLPMQDDPPVSTSHPPVTAYPLLFSHVPSSGTLGILGHNRLLDACAYRWLMQNMHNPYPTSAQLRIIADESLTSVAQAELWFQEARDLIGWTRLSDEFFMGSINATITSAKRVYLEHDNTIPFCIAFAFSQARATMETLFAEHAALPSPLKSHVGSPAQSLQAVPSVNDSTHFNESIEEEEIEDTTPPPSVAGYKRNFADDAATSPTSDLHRPLKRLRTQSLRQVCPHLECMHPLSSTKTSFEKSATEALVHASAIPLTPVRPLDPSFLVGSKPSPDTLTLDPTGQRQTQICGGTSGIAVISPGPPGFQGEMRNQHNSEGSPPSDQQPHSSADHRQHPSPGSVPTFSCPVSPPLGVIPTETTRASQVPVISPDHIVDLSVFDWNSIPNPLVGTTISMNRSASVYVPSSDLAPLNFGITGASQITVKPDAPVDLSVFDWNSIPNPLVKTTISMNQPASVYVPSSDLAAMNCEVPDPLFLEQSTESYPLDDLGSLEDFSLLQFPIPTTFPPDVSASPASFSSDNSTFASPEMDWSAITDFVNQFTTFSAETPSAPSPSSTIDAGPSTPENPTGSLLPPPPHEVSKPISLLDPSIPPSAFLPAEPGIFTDDASSMWSLLCGQS